MFFSIFSHYMLNIPKNWRNLHFEKMVFRLFQRDFRRILEGKKAFQLRRNKKPGFKWKLKPGPRLNREIRFEIL